MATAWAGMILVFVFPLADRDSDQLGPWAAESSFAHRQVGFHRFGIARPGTPAACPPVLPARGSTQLVGSRGFSDHLAWVRLLSDSYIYCQ